MTKLNHLRNRVQTEYNNRKLEEAAELGEALLNEHYHLPEPAQGFTDDLYNLALIYDEMGQLDKAAALYSESSRHLEDNDFFSLAKRSSNLAGVLARMGAVEPAYHFFYQTKHIYQHFVKPNNPEYADSLYNLANISRAAGQVSDALKWHKEALKIREKSGTPDDILHSLHSIAFIHQQEGDYKEAISYAKKALEQASKNDYASACIYLAELYEINDEDELALALYEEVLEKITKEGCKRTDYLTVLCRKAYLKGTTGQIAESIALHQEVCRLYQSLTNLNTPGLDELFYTNTLRNMAILNNAIGETNLAEKYMLQAIKTHKPESGDNIKDICFLIRLYLANDTYDKAIDMMIYALMNTGEEEAKIINALTDAFTNAPDKQKLLAAMKNVNNYEKIQPILDMWRKQGGFI